MPSTPKKTLKAIVESGCHYLCAVKGNQPKLYQAIVEQFVPQQTSQKSNKGHGPIEQRTVSVYPTPTDSFPDWPALATLIRVESYRKTPYKLETATRYYISDIEELAHQFAARIRGYWGGENQVHYLRDVTQGEDASRIRTAVLPIIWSIARNLALNLYRNSGEKNMAQAQRKCAFGLDHLLVLFRMK